MNGEQPSDLRLPFRKRDGGLRTSDYLVTSFRFSHNYCAYGVGSLSLYRISEQRGKTDQHLLLNWFHSRLVYCVATLPLVSETVNSGMTHNSHQPIRPEEMTIK